ncbi:MAG: MFS transporter [Eggerthellaceae bacterium]|nr:MFS transporter [Eggerthellaceae bacterium]
MPSNHKKPSIWSVPYVILMAVNLFQSMAAFMTNTTLPLYVNALGASTATVGMVVSSFSITALLIRPFAGPAFDSFSRKKMLMASQAIISASLIGYGLADSIPQLIAIRLLHGIGIGCGGPLALSLVSEFLPRERFASGISIYTLAQSMAQVIGPAAGLEIVDAIGFSPAYFLAASLVIIAMCGISLIREPERERLPYKLKLDRMFAKEAVAKGIALMLLSTSFSCMGAYVVLYGMERGVESMGFFFVIYALCLLVTRPVTGSLADRFGTPALLVTGTICFGASYILLSVANGPVGFIAAAVAGSAGFGCCAPLLQSFALSSVPESRRGAASNTTFTGLDLGMLFGPLIGGVVIDSLSLTVGMQVEAYSLMWLVMLIPAVGTLAISAYWCVRPASKQARKAQLR